LQILAPNPLKALARRRIRAAGQAEAAPTRFVRGGLLVASETTPLTASWVQFVAMHSIPYRVIRRTLQRIDIGLGTCRAALFVTSSPAKEKGRTERPCEFEFRFSG
jgi:hypothetical protein